jgi:16S rRNA processing protein RimM
VSNNRQRLAARRRNKTAGSLDDGELLFVAVAQVLRPHSLRGEVLVRVLTDFPERLQPGAHLFLGEKHRAVTIKSRQSHNKGLLLSFDEFAAREDVETLRGQTLYVKVEDVPPLESGEYYHHQLIGLHVWAEEQMLGVLTEIIETGANDVYVVRPAEGKEILLPATHEVILDINVEEKRMRVRLLPGMAG